VIDLGVHLVDLALWTLNTPVTGVTSRLFAAGAPLDGGCEDYAEVRLDLADGATVRLVCSWNLPAGRDAVIGATFYGTEGGAALSNVGGSFYDFVAEEFHGTRRTVLASPPDAWGGRAAVAWARQLAAGAGFDPAVERVTEVAAVLDAIYGR
jgi:predicted dehydrogenase